MTTSKTPSSQPESLDLDYDLWQGQFEFVGPSYNINKDLTKSQIKQGVLTNPQILNDDSKHFLSLHADSNNSSTDFFRQHIQSSNEELENMHPYYLSENEILKCPINNIGYTTEIRENHSGKVCFFYIVYIFQLILKKSHVYFLCFVFIQERVSNIFIYVFRCSLITFNQVYILILRAKNVNFYNIIHE